MTPKTEISNAVLLRVRHQLKWKAAAWQMAGQAVARVALGYAVREVRLTPDHSTQSGRCEYYPTRRVRGRNPNRHIQRENRAEIVALLAGCEARVLFDGHRRGLRESDDYQSADKLAAFLIDLGDQSEDQADTMLRHLRWEAEDLVLGNRRAIAAVADALLASDTLTLPGRQVKAIVAGTAG